MYVSCIEAFSRYVGDDPVFIGLQRSYNYVVLYALALHFGSSSLYCLFGFLHIVSGQDRKNKGLQLFFVRR